MNKKSVFFLLFVCLNVFGMVLNVSGQSNTSFPSWIRDAITSASENVLIGVGSAKLDNSQNSLDLAELRARNEISSQIITSVDDMLRDYTMSTNNKSTYDDGYESGYEYVQRVLEQTYRDKNNVRIVRRSTEPDGTSWCLVEMRRR